LLPARQAKNRHNPMNGRVREVRVKTDTGKILRLLIPRLRENSPLALYESLWL